MSIFNSQRGFSQIITVLVLVVGLGVLIAAAQKPTNSIPFASTSNKISNQDTNRRDARTVNLAAFQTPAPVPANAVIKCVYSSPLINNGAPQINNNRSCPTSWTCIDNGQTFSNYKYGNCTPPAGYNATAPLPCNISDNVIAGNGKVSNISCPWRWACVDYNGAGACAAPNGVTFTPTQTQMSCTPNPSNLQSNCPESYNCVPGPTGGVCFGPIPQ